MAALRPNYNVQYKTREKKTTVWPETKLKVQQQATEKQGQTVKRRAKKKIESKKSNYGGLLLINST